MIEFFVNGKKYQKSAPIVVDQLLTELNFLTKGVIVEYNQEFLSPDRYSSTQINNADKLEIVRAFAGG